MTLYHGTRAGFTRGGYVFPRAFHGGKATGAPLLPGRERATDADEHVYATESYDLAWAYAWAARGRGKPKVLTIEPLGPVEPDPEHGVDMLAVRVRGHARVTAVDTDPPFTEAEAREGWAS